MVFPEFRYRGEYLGSNCSLTVIKTFLSTTIGLKAMLLKMNVDLTIAKTVTFRLIAGGARNSSFSGINKSFQKKLPPRFPKYDRLFLCEI